MFAKPHDKQPCQDKRQLLSVPAPLFRLGGWGTLKNRGLFLLAYAASAPWPLPTWCQRHSTQHRTALPRNRIPAHSLVRTLYVLSHQSTQSYKNISAPHICSQGDFRNQNFCSRRHGRDCVQTCILYSPWSMCTKNSLYEKTSIFAINSKQALG